jgi:cytochrome c oxidase assembly factor CtaG
VTAALTTPLDWTGGPALLWVICAATLYWLGGRGGRRAAHGREHWRTAAFAGGLLAILAAVDSPLDKFADELFWSHMTQHILLIGVATPLLALARPWMRMWRGLPISLRREVAREVASPGFAPLRRVATLAGGAIVSWLIFNVTFAIWHLPVLYDAALRWPAIHALEHFLFFATALLFWTRVVDSPPWRSPLSEPAKLAYLASTMVVGWILAIVFASASSPLYAAYAERASRPGNISALTDQQLAAGVMWVPGSLAYTIAIVLIAYRLLEPRHAPGRGHAKPAPRGVG